MDSSKNENGKIIKAFCVCGLNELKIQKYTEETQYPFIQYIDLVEKKMQITMNSIEMNGEKW